MERQEVQGQGLQYKYLT